MNRALLILLGVVVFGDLPTRAEETFREDVVVTAIEVPVQVLRNGKPVRGLTRDDFEIYDRGERRELTDFEVVDVGTARDIRRANRAGAGKAQPTKLELQTERGRRLLFLFDFQYSRERRLERSVAAARKIMKRGLAQGDRAAVAVFAGTAGAQLLVGFSRDAEEVERGLRFVEAVLDRDREGLDRAREDLVDYWVQADPEEAGSGRLVQLRRMIDRLGPAAALALSGAATTVDVMGLEEYDEIAGFGGVNRGGGGSLADRLLGPGLVDDRAVELESGLSMLRKFGASMGELATLLRDVPSPKHLFYFSEGFSSEFLTNPVLQGRAINRVNKGIRLLQASGWSIQAIDIEGVPDSLAATGRSAENFGDPQPTAFVTGAGRGQLETPAGRAGFNADALFYLANETGGQVLENFNSVEDAARRLLEATAVTYILVFQPEDLIRDGAFRKLDVELAAKVPGTRILHRPGYVAPSPLDEATDVERWMDAAEVMAGEAEITELVADSLVVTPRVGANGRASASFLVEVAAAELAGDWSFGILELELQAYAYGVDESLHDFVSQRLTIDPVDVAERLDGGLKLTGNLDLPAGSHHVRLVVRDLAGERTFARSHPVSVPGSESALALPPVWLDPATATLFLEARTRQEGLSAWDAIGLPLNKVVPAAAAAFAPGEKRALYLAGYSVDLSSPQVEYRVLSEGGDPRSGARLEWYPGTVEGNDGSSGRLGIFDVGSLEPGSYRLEVSVGAESEERAAVSSSGFEVVAPL